MNARRKVELMRAEQNRRERRRRFTVAGIAAAIVALAAVLTIAFWPSGSNSTSSKANPGRPTVLVAAGQLTGAPVDGIESGTAEQLAFHIHAHLRIYVDGQERLVAQGIGIIPNSAIYWLHTHDESGVIHMEAPRQFTFTLGDFFDMWKQPLSASQVGPARGSVTVLVDGKRVTGDPRQVKLDAHAVVQLDVGAVVPFKPYVFADGLDD